MPPKCSGAQWDVWLRHVPGPSFEPFYRCVFGLCYLAPYVFERAGSPARPSGCPTLPARLEQQKAIWPPNRGLKSRHQTRLLSLASAVAPSMIVIQAKSAIILKQTWAQWTKYAWVSWPSASARTNAVGESNEIEIQQITAYPHSAPCASILGRRIHMRIKFSSHVRNHWSCGISGMGTCQGEHSSSSLHMSTH